MNPETSFNPLSPDGVSDVSLSVLQISSGNRIIRSDHHPIASSHVPLMSLYIGCLMKISSMQSELRMARHHSFRGHQNEFAKLNLPE